MRIRGKFLLPALAGAAGVVGLIAAPAGIARADVSASLPITSFYQVVADSAHGHLFISQGSGGVSHVLVTDLAGHQVASIGGQDGATGMALSQDGGTLYVALAASHSVSAISTATLLQTASYPIGDANTPADVAVQSGKVWVSYNTGIAGTAAIGDIDLTAASPAFQTQAAMGSWYSAPQLAADPSGSGVLVAALPAMSPSSVSSYNTAVEPATVRAHSGFFQNCVNQADLAVFPGGARFAVACGWPYNDYRYSTADLSQQGFYPSQAYPDAIAISPAGAVATGVRSGAPDISVYQPGAGTPVNSYEVGGANIDLAPRGLAWSADSSRLFAVVRNQTTATYSLRVLSYPALPRPRLTVTTGTASVGYNTVVHITAHLGTTFSNRTVSIYAQPFGGARTLLRTGTVNSAGNLTVSYVAPHSTTFSAAFTGDAKFGPVTASAAVTVRARVAFAISGYYASKSAGAVTYRLYHRAGHLNVAVLVTPNKHGECVKAQAQEYFGGAWHPNVITACQTLSAASRTAGYLTVSKADLGIPYRIRADYVRSTGDTSNVNSSSSWLYFKVEK